MKAAVFHGPHQQLTIEEIAIDDPGPREVIVKTAASGVCHSDLHFVDGLYPFDAPAILGHEAAGIVGVGGRAGDVRAARRPRDLLPLGVLRHVRALHDGSALRL